MRFFFFLAMTKDVGFYKCFKDNLKFVGCKPLIFRSKSSKLGNYYNLFKLIIYIPLAKKSQGLMIRADLFSDKFINIFTSKLNKAYGYQWDGLSRYPRIFNKIHLFDKFYVFDKEDLYNNEKLHQLNNFYFDCYKKLKKTIKIEYDVYYVGSYDKRIEKIIEICSVLYKMGLKMNIKIPCSGEQAEYLKTYSFIDTSKSSRTYIENIKNVFASRIILDFAHENLHNGISFRAFEALGYEKKLITTNTFINEEDFFNEENILIIDSNTKKEEIEYFISNRDNYKSINKEIYEKYSFTNWFKSLTDSSM